MAYQKKRQRRAAVIEKPQRKNARKTKPSPPTTSRGIRRQEEIKAAAARVLERLGYSNLTLADVAEEAGINVSLLYHYFTDKDDLVFAVLTDAINSTELFSQAPKSDDRYLRIFEANLKWVEFYQKHPGIMRCVMHFGEAQSEFYEHFRDETAKHNRRIAADIAKQVSESPVSPQERLLIAHVLGAMVDAFLFDRYVDQNPDLTEALPTPGDVAEFLSIIWYRALYLSPPPGKNINKFKKLARLSYLG